MMRISRHAREQWAKRFGGDIEDAIAQSARPPKKEREYLKGTKGGERLYRVFENALFVISRPPRTVVTVLEREYVGYDVRKKKKRQHRRRRAKC